MTTSACDIWLREVLQFAPRHYTAQGSGFKSTALMSSLSIRRGAYVPARRRSLANVGDYLGFDGALIRADAPNNPFGRDIVVTAPAVGGDVELRDRLDAKRITASLDFALADRWRMTAERTRSISALTLQQPAASSAAAEIATGRFDVLRDLMAQPLDLSSWISITIGF